MVTSTKLPNVLRVSFVIDSDPKSETEIVCLIEATSAGKMRVWYRHHIVRQRPTGVGAWSPDSILQHHAVSPMLKAVIRTHLMNELFSCFCNDGDIGIEKPPHGPAGLGAGE